MKLATIVYQHLISEGVYDPSIFKVIFVVGGIGSGKSYVTDKVTQGLGFRLIDVDRAFELLMNRSGLSLKMPPEESPERDKLFSKSREITANTMNTHFNGRLGMIIAGTGSDYDQVAKLKEKLEQYGYDAFLIFVNTTLEKSLERNRKRYRSIPDDVTKTKWAKAQQNIGKFQSMMGISNMAIIDNTDENNQKSLDALWKNVMLFARRPISNYIAKRWIQQQLTDKNKLPKPGNAF